MNEVGHVVFRGESPKDVALVLEHSLVNIARDADVEHVALAAHDVEVVSF